MSRGKQRPRNNEENRGQTGKNEQRADQPENNDDQFPGYPHYPAKEDIMSPASEMERVQLDVENLTPSGRNANVAQQQLRNPMSNQPATETTASNTSTEDADLSLTPGTEADVTKDDLIVLGGTKFSDNDLQNNTRTNLLSADDLDIPGSELDNPNEDIGEEDEENNYYSLGGERHENLEEDPTV